eukprot:6196052-Pleurochrysis_carterae.AAC.1
MPSQKTDDPACRFSGVAMARLTVVVTCAIRAVEQQAFRCRLLRDNNVTRVHECGQTRVLASKCVKSKRKSAQIGECVGVTHNFRRTGGQSRAHTLPQSDLVYAQKALVVVGEERDED